MSWFEKITVLLFALVVLLIGVLGYVFMGLSKQAGVPVSHVPVDHVESFERMVTSDSHSVDNDNLVLILEDESILSDRSVLIETTAISNDPFAVKQSDQDVGAADLTTDEQVLLGNLWLPSVEEHPEDQVTARAFTGSTGTVESNVVASTVETDTDKNTCLLYTSPSPRDS